MHPRPDEMDAHEQRHRHPKKNAEQRQPKVVEPNRLVIGVEEVARQEASLTRILVTCSAVVYSHVLCAAGPLLFPCRGAALLRPC